ncbi:MAG: hypothetical protein MUE97_08275 [Phycisphaerales bacterium]|nr:hypothetical protein [Phycisphaerales bacterium]
MGAGGSSGSSDTDVDTRSDVYALGIVLYELLTGRTPLDRQTLAKSSLIEVMRLVRESEAPAPSAVRSGGAEPGGQAVPRELDWIVLRAIEKDRSRRYQSAADMAADIERFLRHQPVLARPPSLAYRAAKFVRRRRGLVALAAGASVIAGSALVWAGVNFFEAQRQRDAATALAAAERLARDQADLATRRSERTQEFLLNILRAANINTPGKRKDATIAEALEAATAQLDDPKRQVDPPVDTKIRQVIAVAYIGLGVYDRAEAQSAKAMTLARTLPAAEATVLSDVLTTRVTALRNVRRDEEAVPLAQEAVRLAEAGLASVPVDAPAMVKRNAQIRLADALGTAVSLVSGTPSEAELAMAARSVALHEEVYGVASHRALGAAMRQAVLLGYAERYPEALVVARRVVEQTRASETPRSYAMSVRLDTLAVLTRLSGDAATSATLHDEAIAMAIEFVGPEDVRLATLYGNAAEAQIAIGNQARAAEMLVRSHTIYTTGNPTALAGHARGAERIGESLLKINHPADAAMVYERGLAALTTLIEQAGTDEAKAELLARRTAMEAKLAEARRAIK